MLDFSKVICENKLSSLLMSAPNFCTNIHNSDLETDVKQNLKWWSPPSFIFVKSKICRKHSLRDDSFSSCATFCANMY